MSRRRRGSHVVVSLICHQRRVLVRFVALSIAEGDLTLEEHRARLPLASFPRCRGDSAVGDRVDVSVSHAQGAGGRRRRRTRAVFWVVTGVLISLFHLYAHRRAQERSDRVRPGRSNHPFHIVIDENSFFERHLHKKVVFFPHIYSRHKIHEQKKGLN